MSEKSKNILLGVLIVGLVSMTVAYAALSTSLSIRGTATVEATKWDVHFANVNVDTAKTTIPDTQYSLGTLDEQTGTGTGTLISGLTATLKKPTDKLVVNFDIVNAGTIDARVTHFDKHITRVSSATGSIVDTDVANTNDVVTYTIACNTGNDQTGGNEGETLAKNNGTTSCTLTVQYDNNAMNGAGQQTSQTAGENQTVNQPEKIFKFDANWTYQQ